MKSDRLTILLNSICPTTIVLASDLFNANLKFTDSAAGTAIMTKRLYKFIGGSDASLAEVFDSIFLSGTMKFGAALRFNDPFEFKFRSIAPQSRAMLDHWHDNYSPATSMADRDSAWQNFTSEKTRYFSTEYQPRVNLLSAARVLCLSNVWDNHLMWSHYASMHTGFCAVLNPDVVKEYQEIDGFAGAGFVSYGETVPEVKWFNDTPEEMVAALIFNKSSHWQYEEEFRVLFLSDSTDCDLFVPANPQLITGVLLGNRCSPAIKKSALTLRDTRPDFVVKRVVSKPGSYELALDDVEETRESLRGIL